MSVPLNAEVICNHPKTKKIISKLANNLADMLDFHCSKRKIVFIVVLKGGAKFAFKLFDYLIFPFEYTFAQTVEQDIDKYRKSLGQVKILYDNFTHEQIDGNVIVILDDICDSGATIKTLTRRLKDNYRPHEIRSCTLVWRNYSDFRPDIFGVSLASKNFVIGWGMGLGEEFRNLNSVYELLVPEEV